MNNHPILDKFPFPTPPVVNEEYFEWIDLLISVWQAKKHFIMAELGAGYGRWGVAGLRAAAQRGLRSQVIFVEAEPRHCQMLEEAIDLHFGDPRNNGFAEVYEKAIAYEVESVPFFIRQGELGWSNWYGQHVCPLDDGEPTDNPYHGMTVLRSKSCPECEYVQVSTITLAAVLDRQERVDLVDMDLQGMEQQLVEREMDVLTAKVHKVHIGTHSREAEASIRECFTKSGWHNIWDFVGGQTNATPYGPVNFQDGVQTWQNPRL